MDRPPETGRPDEGWRRIDALFRRALDVVPEGRDAFLRDEAGPDEGLRRSVESLLRDVAEAGDFLETPAEAACDIGWDDFRAALESSVPGGGAGTGTMGGAPADRVDRKGERIGPYRLGSRLGRGGMATVYLAERVDGQWEQRVAVKVIRRGLDTEDVVRRFVAERQILSSLEHPNICRLLDGGSTADGLPYLVMELVEGRPITEHADTERLSVEERLALFTEVCDAVQFAHQKLVVHRDLKPSNILVSGDGVVKLLDFGIAKLLDDTSDERTRTGRRMLTPQYASPEQIRGESITTASDVYQLGVLLCRLLTGRRPYEVEGLSPAVVEAKIAEATPERPSRLVTDESGEACRLGARRLVRRLEGDLDAIALKALRPEPGARYATAESLAADVRRHLEGLPVDAARGALGYRMRKFARRHTLGLATAAAVVLLLGAGAGALAVQRSRAVRAADRAEQVSAFLASVFQDVDPTAGVGDTMSARTMLSRGAQRIEQELTDQPELQAELFGVIGNAFMNLGRLDEAIEILRARLYYARIAYSPPDERLEEALGDLGNAYNSQRNVAASIPLLEELITLRRERRGPDAVEVAELLVTLAGRIRDVVGPDSAEVLLRQGLAVPGLDPESPVALSMRLSLAYVLRGQDRPAEAAEIYRETLPRYRATDPDRGDLALHLNNYAYALKILGERDEAAAVYRDAQDTYAGVYGTGHPTSLLLLTNLAGVLQDAGRGADLEAVLQERLEDARQQWPQGHWRVASALEDRGSANLRFGDGAIAVERLREAIDMYAETLGPAHSWTATARAWLGAALLARGDETGGTREIDRAVRDLTNYQGSDGIEDRSFAVDRIAGFLESRGHADRAAGLRALFADDT